MDTVLLGVRGRLRASGEAKGQNGESFDEAHDWFIVGKIETKFGVMIVDEMEKEGKYMRREWGDIYLLNATGVL